MNIDWNQLIQTVAIVFLPVIATVLGIWIRSHMNDKAAADAISQALNNALGAMQQAVQKGLTDGAIKKAGVEYVKAVVPEALARDPSSNTDALIGEKLDARMGVANIATNLAVAASPLPAAPAPLAPVVNASADPAPFVPQPKVFGMEGKAS
jgi:hypothetical protein